MGHHKAGLYGKVVRRKTKIKHQNVGEQTRFLGLMRHEVKLSALALKVATVKHSGGGSSIMLPDSFHSLFFK